MSKRDRYDGLGEPITDKECIAITFLSEGGWDCGRVKIAFGFDTDEIALKHIENRCEHGKNIYHLKLNNVRDEININNNTENYHINAFECNAITLLNNNGWTHKTLKMIFELNKHSVRLHSNNKCSHMELSYLIRE